VYRADIFPSLANYLIGFKIMQCEPLATDSLFADNFRSNMRDFFRRLPSFSATIVGFEHDSVFGAKYELELAAPWP
jgi:hypothetical protein